MVVGCLRKEMRVWLNHSNLTIEIREGDELVYYIDLEKCTNSAETLDWIMQVWLKSWCTPELISEVIGVLNGACLQHFDQPVQGAICPMGVDRQVKWQRPHPSSA